MFEDSIRYVDDAQTLEALNFAKEIGHTEIVLLFSKHSEGNKTIAEKLAKESKLKIVLGLDVLPKEAQKHSTKYDVLFSLATRDAIENKHIMYLYGAETLEEKDRTHQRGSGFNHVLVKMISEKEKVYCYDFSLLLHARDTSMILGRMMQNKKFFTKYKTQTKLFTFARSWEEVRSTSDKKHFLNNI